MWKSPTKITTRQRTKVISLCSACNEEVSNDDKALLCELCENWEHQHCVRQADRLSEELYSSITNCNSKSIVYVCMACRQKGSLGKRLLTCQLECARANEQQLASERLLEERQRTIKRLLVDKQELLSERNHLRDKVRGVKKLPPLVSVTDTSTALSSEVETTQQLSDDQSSGSEHNNEINHDRGNQRRPPRRTPRLVQPPGFKEIRSRVGKFSGRKGEDDFNLWLADYQEATDHFTWSDDT